MRNYLQRKFLFCWICILFFINCNAPTPEKYFNVAVLNTNMLFGFADNGMLRQLESPSAKLSGDDGKTIPMMRSEVVDQKIEFIKSSYKDIQDLPVTEDTKEMIDASLAVYEYVLPVFNVEYIQLAKLYDSGAPEDQIQSLSKSIHEKYFPGYNDRYYKLLAAGKSYADKHKIKVNWGVY